MTPKDLFSARYLSALVIILAFTAGCVDAVSYLGLGHIFTANMTGNLVLMAIAVAQGKLLTAIRSMIALVGFVMGAYGASVMLLAPSRSRPWRNGIPLALASEGTALAAFVLIATAFPHFPSHWLIYLITFLAGFAMGIQSNVARHLNLAGLTTTVVTSTLATLVEDVSLRIVPAAWESVSPQKLRASSGMNMIMRASVIVTYGAGALLSGLAGPHMFDVVAIPVLLMFVFLISARFQTRESAH